LRGATDCSALEHQGQVGAVVETWVALELMKMLPVMDHRFRLYFWRTHAGHEVDFLVEIGEKIVGIEVKWGHRIKDSDLITLKQCSEDLGGRLHFSLIIYGGTETVAFTPRIVAVAFSVFFGIEG
jgi:predicted AAA+ superfamily ATPase